MPLRFSIRDLLWLTVLVCGCSRQQPVVNPFPSLAEVETMDAQYVDPATKFAVPRANWETVLDALRPARIDPDPDKWPALGWLQLNCKGGRTFTVGLFDIPVGPGAFATGDNFKRQRLLSRRRFSEVKTIAVECEGKFRFEQKLAAEHILTEHCPPARVSS